MKRIKTKSQRKDKLREIYNESKKIKRFIKEIFRLNFKVRVVVSNRKNSESYFDEDRNIIKINTQDRGWIGFPKEGKDIRYLIFHELGHKIFHILNISKIKGSRIFGDFSKNYEKSRGTHCINEVKSLPSFISLYAQTHPEEDFSETFALYFYRIYINRKIKIRAIKNKNKRMKLNFIKHLPLLIDKQV